MSGLRNSIRHAPCSACSNASLALDRYMGLFKLTEDEAKGLNEKEINRKALINAVLNIAPSNLYKLAYYRWKEFLSKDALTKSENLIASEVGRLILGLGQENVLEAGMTFQKIYGVPVIPGSAIKGIARSFFFKEVAPKIDEQAEREAYEIILFGTTDRGGMTAYYDAWLTPATKSPLRGDVITTHHQGYYTQEDRKPAPTDFDDPIPVSFLSCAGSFCVAVKSQDADWSEFALNLVKQAISEYGIGGKTSSGYGRLAGVTSPGIINGGTTELRDPADELIEKITTSKMFKSDLDTQLWKPLKLLPDGLGKKRAAKVLAERMDREKAWTSGKNKKEKSWANDLRKLLE